MEKICIIIIFFLITSCFGEKEFFFPEKDKYSDMCFVSMLLFGNCNYRKIYEKNLDCSPFFGACVAICSKAEDYNPGICVGF
ncbi:MAG: hypothetical protein H7A23_11110 [Leptospiraceae bacterium]|nr:hypothetical protein [Leptospiraceae bacterium]